MRSPRIALKQPAARGLKAWAAIEDREPAAILEELVLANLPAKVKELLGEEPGAKGAEEPGSPGPQAQRGQGPQELRSPKPAVITPHKAIVADVVTLSKPIAAALTPGARQALAYILEELESGREPTSREAAEKVGLTPTGLGMELSRHGIKAKNTRRDMKSVKIYVKPMIARIKELLAI